MKKLFSIFLLASLMSSLVFAGVNTEDLYGLKFKSVGDDSGMDAFLTISKAGSVTFKGSVLKEFCETNVKTIKSSAIELFDSYERQVLAFMPKNKRCREVQSFVAEIPDEQKKKMKESWKYMSDEEKKQYKDQYEAMMNSTITLMLCYGSMADGEFIMMFDY